MLMTGGQALQERAFNINRSMSPAVVHGKGLVFAPHTSSSPITHHHHHHHHSSFGRATPACPLRRSCRAAVTGIAMRSTSPFALVASSPASRLSDVCCRACQPVA